MVNTRVASLLLALTLLLASSQAFLMVPAAQSFGIPVVTIPIATLPLLPLSKPLPAAQPVFPTKPSTGFPTKPNTGFPTKPSISFPAKPSQPVKVLPANAVCFPAPSFPKLGPCLSFPIGTCTVDANCTDGRKCCSTGACGNKCSYNYYTPAA